MRSQSPGATFPDSETLVSERDIARPSAVYSAESQVGSASWLSNPVVYFILLLLAATPGLVQLFFGPDDNDVAWGLYVAGRIFDGARLYVDIIEVNPPLIFVLSMPAKLLSRVTGISDILLFELMVLAFIVGSLAFCAVLLRRIAPAAKDLVLRRVFILVAAFALFAVPSNSNVFAQREHILMILLLPYLVAAAARSMGVPLPRREALLVGLMAGVGIALKPYFVLPWLLVEVYLAVRVSPRKAWLRPEVIVIVAVGLLYLAGVLILFPGYLALVAVLREVYGGFLPTTYIDILTDDRAIYVAAAFLAVWVTPPDDTSRDLRRVIALATVGFAMALLIQHKGWIYQWYPPLAGATLLLGLAVLDAVRNSKVPRSAPLIRQATPLIAAACFVVIAVNSGKDVVEGLHPPPDAPYARAVTGPMTRLIRQEANGESISALSALPEPMFPAVNYTGVRWASRFFHLWPLNGPYLDQRWSKLPVRYHTPAKMGRAERFAYDVVISDMLRDPPRLLFVMIPPAGTLPSPRFDYVKYFSQDPRFVRAMQDYRVLGKIGEYRVYKRTTAQGAAR